MIRQHGSDASVNRSIINISSVSATLASVNRGDYCISKAGVAMATRLWAVRLAEYGIGVYEVRPGIIATEMTAGVKDKYDALIEDGCCSRSAGNASGCRPCRERPGKRRTALCNRRSSGGGWRPDARQTVAEDERAGRTS